LLRTLFGWIYIAIPHGFLLIFFGLWSLILTFIAWWVVLFTGVYPRNFFSYQERLIRWAVRLNARLFNLADGYPAFRLNATDDKIVLDIPYPERLGRGHLLLRTFFGFFYCILPHGFILMFRQLATMVLVFLAFWVVLFTGKKSCRMARIQCWNPSLELQGEPLPQLHDRRLSALLRKT